MAGTAQKSCHRVLPVAVPEKAAAWSEVLVNRGRGVAELPGYPVALSELCNAFRTPCQWRNPPATRCIASVVLTRRAAHIQQVNEYNSFCSIHGKDTLRHHMRLLGEITPNLQSPRSTALLTKRASLLQTVGLTGEQHRGWRG